MIPRNAPGRIHSILFVHGSDEAYGADRVLIDIVLGLRERGHRVAVLIPDDVPPGWLSERLAGAGISVERGPLAVARRRYLTVRRLPGYLLDLIRARRHIRRSARAVRATIIHVNTSAILAAGIVGRPDHAHLVWHVHEMVIKPRATALVFRLVPAFVADRVIAVSHAVAEHLVAPGPLRRRIAVVWNGLPPRPPADPPGDLGDEPLVAFIGRINRWKGADIFVSAIGLIASHHPGVRFAIAGDALPGETWREIALARQIGEAGLVDRIQCLGRIDDVPALLDRASIVVAPSIWPEPFGLVIAEAMRSGCAVVATAHGGAAEIVVDGVTGLLIPPGDVRALASALDRLLANPEQRARFGDEGKARIERHFSLGATIDGVEGVYSELGYRERRT